MKGTLRLRPVFHYREDRIRAHVQLCRLALLLIRVTENATGDTWCNIRHQLDRIHLVTLATPDGRSAQHAVTSPASRPSSARSSSASRRGSSTSPPRPASQADVGPADA